MRTRSLRARLIAVILGVSWVTIAAGFSIDLVRDIRELRHQMESNARLQATLVAEYCVGPLTFGYLDEAEEVLQKLIILPTVQGAWLFDEDGRLFADYLRPGDFFEPPARPADDAGGFANASLHVVTPVTFQGERFGTLYLRLSTTALHGAIWRRLLTLIAFSLPLLLFSFLLAAHFQRSISGPILRLAEVSGDVSSTQDLSVRLPVTGNDEIALLYQRFNEMFEELERRQSERDEAEAELRQLNLELEDRVEQRTDELRRALVEAEEANEAKSHFLANMSHEVRTPLNAIMGLIQLMEGTSLSSLQRDYLHKMTASSRTLLRIIGDILDFSKIEAGKLEMESVPFDLGEVLDDLCSITQARAKDKDVEIVFRLDPGLPHLLAGDPLRLEQVLVNLLDNAIKFTQEGEIVMSAELVEASGRDARVAFTVRDTGIGMSEEQMNRLFEAFTQADASTTRRFGGTGLGLAISRRLVELMGGRLTARSEVGVGSEFRVEAVFELRDVPGAVAEPAGELKGLRVLVVDDNPTSRSTLGQMLESFSFEVTLAASGEEGIAELARAGREHPYQLVLMDWQMPGLDGIEASRKIKRRDDLPAMPTIIMVTAFGREELMLRAEAAGIEGFLIKPVSPSILFNTIQSVTGGRETGPELAAASLDSRWSGLRGARVLLVEDNEVNQFVARELLEAEGVRVVLATDGRQAIEKVEREPFDAVLMDIQMPGMGGIEATEEIRRREENRDLPIIAMTANAMAGDRERYLAAGMNDHVPKPIDAGKLFEVLLERIQPAGSEPRSGPFEAAGDEGDRGAVIDARAGLRLVGGKQQLYLRLLHHFRVHNETVAEELARALGDGDVEVALGTLHTLKGQVGYLGAHRLQQAVADLERSLRAEEPGEKRWDPLLHRFQKRLSAVLEKADELLAEADFADRD